MSCSIQTFSPFGNAGLDSRSIPQMIGILGCVLSVLQIVLSWHGIKHGPTEHAHKPEDASHGEGGNSNKPNFTLFLSLFLLGAYIAALQDLGFILSSLLYLILFIMLLTPKEKRLKAIPFTLAFSAAISLSLYYVFTRYLTLLLPKGILG